MKKLQHLEEKMERKLLMLSEKVEELASKNTGFGMIIKFFWHDGTLSGRLSTLLLRPLYTVPDTSFLGLYVH